MSEPKAAVDLSNWRDDPHNKWAFRNIDKILMTDVIKKADQPSRLESGPRPFENIQIDVQGYKLDLSTFVQATSTDGLLVLHEGKIVLEKYFNGNDQHSKHILMSMTKSITALLVGILQTQGKLYTGDLVTKFVPEVGETLYRDVTIQQCLDMRSGLVYPDNSHDYRAAMGWVPLNGSEKHDNLHDFIQNLSAEKAEHDGFQYVSANTDLLGWVVERASGMSFAKVVQHLLWQSMGAESDALVTLDGEGNARAAGGLCATLRDMGRLGQLIIEDGGGIVPSDFIQDIVSGGDRQAWAKGSWAAAFTSFPNLAYRSHCLADSSLDLIIGMGIHGQMLFADRKNKMVMVKTGSQTEAIDGKAIFLSVRAYQEMARLVVSSEISAKTSL